MSGRLLRFSDYAPKPGEYLLLLSDLPGHGVKTIGVVLLDRTTDTLHIRLRRDWHTVGEDEDIEVLAELEDDLRAQEREHGGAAVFDRLEESSQSLRTTDREVGYSARFRSHAERFIP